ncbi:MAG: FixH family protein [Prevotella sp.]|nr:FixH family protein [Prevotella sp.]
MQKKTLTWLFALAIIFGFHSCSSSDDSPVDINIPADDDEECCNDGEEYLTRVFLAKQNEVEQVSGIVSGDYIIKVYASDSEFKVGYNDVYFTVEKAKNGKHVKDFTVSNITPLMEMGNMNGMKHSTPVASSIVKEDGVPVLHAWISFLMPSDSEKNHQWTLSFDYTIKGTSGHFDAAVIDVKPLATGHSYVKSFKYNDATYYLSLVNPARFATGVNTIQAYISKQSAEKETPYLEAGEAFTVDIYPTMPDMGNHTSPNNESLTRQSDGSYQGKLNLTMTGTWDIHLAVKAENGQIVAGTESKSGSLSELFWTISI